MEETTQMLLGMIKNESDKVLEPVIENIKTDTKFNWWSKKNKKIKLPMMIGNINYKN